MTTASADGSAGARPAPGQLEEKREAVVACYRECIDALDQLDAMDHPQTSVDLFRDTLNEFEMAAHANGYMNAKAMWSGSVLPGAAASGREDEVLLAAGDVDAHCRAQLLEAGFVVSDPEEVKQRGDEDEGHYVAPDKQSICAALRARSAPRPGGQAAGDDLQAASAELHMAIGELQDIARLNRSARQAVSLALGHMLKSADGIEAVLARAPADRATANRQEG